MILQYTVRVYTTHDSKAAQECVLGGHTEKSESDEGWKLLISNQKERKINCIKDGNNNYKVMHNHSSVQCADTSIASIKIDDTNYFKGIQLLIPKIQGDYTVEGVTVNLDLRTTDSVNIINNLRYAFAVITVLVLYLFWRKVKMTQ